MFALLLSITKFTSWHSSPLWCDELWHRELQYHSYNQMYRYCDCIHTVYCPAISCTSNQSVSMADNKHFKDMSRAWGNKENKVTSLLVFPSRQHDHEMEGSYDEEDEHVSWRWSGSSSLHGGRHQERDGKRYGVGLLHRTCAMWSVTPDMHAGWSPC